MKIDHTLILAAGKGTRMGEIGKVLPKVIWPIFEKSIIELEVAYAKRLGIKNISTNLYHYKDKLLDFYNSNKVLQDINHIVEPEVLDVGGAVHNMAKVYSYNGVLLILNSDQFIMIGQKDLNRALDLLKNHDVVLFTYNVSKIDRYNKLEINSERLLEKIVPNSQVNQDFFETYTGMALINLEKLEKREGLSKFFETVANPKTMKVYCQNINNASYWDFGTLKRYQKSMFDALDVRNRDDAFIQFLIDEKALNLSKIKEMSYNSNNLKGINLSDERVDLGNKSILLKSKNNQDYLKNSVIYYESICEDLN